MRAKFENLAKQGEEESRKRADEERQRRKAREQAEKEAAKKQEEERLRQLRQKEEEVCKMHVGLSSCLLSNVCDLTHFENYVIGCTEDVSVKGATCTAVYSTIKYHPGIVSVTMF